VLCETCPEGAACFGKNHSRVIPKVGFYRLPWVADGLVFAECREPSACKGYDAAVGVPSCNSTDCVIDNVFASLAASSGAACAEGYSGNLCFACSINYARRCVVAAAAALFFNPHLPLSSTPSHAAVEKQVVPSVRTTYWCTLPCWEALGLLCLCLLTSSTL
jgi:hypothetical protein